MTLPEYIHRYEARAERFSLLPTFQIHFESEQGFFCWAKFGPVFEVDHVCTNNARYFYDVANEMAKVRGCVTLRTQTFHNPASFMRLLKCTPNLTLSGVRPNGRMYWTMEKKVK